VLAAGLSTSVAQSVFSVNAVGYVNVSIPFPAVVPANVYAILANPLNGTNNLIGTIIPVAPDGTTVYQFKPTGGYRTIYYIGPNDWLADDAQPTTLAPGEGFFINLDTASAPNPTVVTFVGEVPQGNLTNSVQVGYSIRSSIVPQTGKLQTDLGYNPDEGGNDLVYDFNISKQTYDTYYYLGGNAWFDAQAAAPGEPVLNVGRGMFFFNGGTGNIAWGRTFSVN
jgi:hypothetical protein